MLHPALLIDRLKFRDNALKLKAIFNEQNKKIHFVTKCFCAHEGMVQTLAEAGIRNLADSRLENFRVLQKYAQDSLLLRLPMLSEVSEVVSLCDISLNSEYETIAALSDAALVQQKIHRIILMLEMGDRREGAAFDEAAEMIGKIVNLRGVRLVGIGANFNCYGGVIPDEQKMQELANFADFVENRYGFELDYVSGGNSGSLWLLAENKLPAKVNHLRIGEALLLGRETSFGRSFGGLHHDIFTLRAEVIEAKRKHSLPDGRIGLNALGEEVHFKDEGMINRVILALGAQDVLPENLVPKLRGVKYLGHSSDHTIFDVTKLNKDLNLGDKLDFALDYSCLLRLFTSPYVKKFFV